MTKQDRAIKQAARLAAPVFAAMGWTWCSTHPHTPTIPEIAATYRELIKSVKRHGGEFSETGRLGVRFYKDIPGEFELYVLVGGDE